jgi:hypothetical protein
MTNMPLDEIPKNIGPAFTPEAAIRGMKKKMMPVQEYFKKNKAALWKSEALE